MASHPPPLNTFAIHVGCGPSVWSVQSFDLLACQRQSVFPLTCVMSRSLSVVTQSMQSMLSALLSTCSQSFHSLVVSGPHWQGLRIGRRQQCDGVMVAQPGGRLHGRAHRQVQDLAGGVRSSLRHAAPYAPRLLASRWCATYSELVFVC